MLVSIHVALNNVRIEHLFNTNNKRSMNVS